ncbi:MAG: phosphonoacetate hydrolase [Phycisphaerales bacterium JB063]
MPADRSDSFAVNGRTYALPACPVVVICIDGCADEYLSVSIAHGKTPNLLKMSVEGYRGMARACLPTFTNVNNGAIVTGTPPSETGICGNFFLDPETGEEVMMNDSRFLRNDTILAAAENAGRKVAFVTAKDKLRELYAKGMRPDGMHFSAEKADEAKARCGIDIESLVGPKPNIYSGDASVYTLKAGARLLEEKLADFLYLSLTDYMQHAYAPEEAESLAFYAELDEQVGRMLELGALVAITADHGMNAKCDADGLPQVIYLEQALEAVFGEGVRVICPITDPYVVHHGALGSAVTVHLPDRILSEKGGLQRVQRWLLEQPGVTEVVDKTMAQDKLQLASDRIGDLYVFSGRGVVLGRRPEYHDIAALKKTLRSHGGRYEEMVPLLVSRPLSPAYLRKAQGDPRNYDVFDFACNGTQC